MKLKLKVQRFADPEGVPEVFTATENWDTDGLWSWSVEIDGKAVEVWVERDEE